MYFVTDTGLKVPAITADQMREVDRIAVEETGPNLFQMMENAGRNLALLAMEILGNDWNKKSIVVLAGFGNNGGGGICSARHLLNRKCSVALYITEPGKLTEAPAYQRKVFNLAGGKEISFQELNSQKPGLIIDAIIGYGLRSFPKGNVFRAIQWANNSGAKILSLDIPSGIDATTGKFYGEFIKADTTLTLALPKTGLRKENSGKLFLGDIGISPNAFSKLGLEFVPPFDERFILRLE